MKITDNIKHIPTRMMAILVIAFVCVGTLHAQSHGNHIMLGVGGSYPRGVEATIAYEHETEYHSAWEYFASNMKKTQRLVISPMSLFGTAIIHGL